MFTRRGYGDVKKSTQKVLDPKKDVLTRLKHLRSLLDNCEKSELKALFETNCSQIYFIFYENFITLESNLKQKGKERTNDVKFDVLQKILQLLPEKIYSRWQFHSIGSILKKLLHTGNSFKIRCEGMRLFLLWLQALQTNCAEEQLLIFACLVPGFPAVLSSRGPCTLDTIIYNPFSNPPDAKIVPEEITPLVPAVPGEKVADDQTCYILQTVLKFMVIQASSLEWHKKDNQDTGFRFLFSLFKKYYLPHLFPSFTKVTNLYKPLLDLPHHRPKPLYVPVSRNNESTFCTRDQYLAPRVAFITWLVNFFLEKKYVSAATTSTKNGGEVLPKIMQTVTAGSSSQEKSSEQEPNGPVEQEKNHSNSSTLSDRRGSNSSLCSIEEEHRSVYDMVHCILLSTRDNVNFVNEVFHQAFLLPSCEASATRKVIKVYRKWILQERPTFMTEPEKTEHDEEEVEEGQQPIETDDTHSQVLLHGHKRSSSWGRTYSFSSAISRGCLTEQQNHDVKAGIQPTLQVFLTNSANVFLLEPCQDVPKLLENQVEVCRAVLSIYRHMIMEQNMNRQTWEQMLQVLLRITEAVMKRPQEDQRKDVFAQSLASVLFRTIIVAWVRANLCVFISRELWDELLAVLSSLSHWEELVSEWASIMDSLTVVLARYVYGLDLNNLPLDKLSEQKEKKQRGRGVMQDSQKSSSSSVARSFSLSWRNSGDQPGAGAQEPMRFRSATTTGAPAVEKAQHHSTSSPIKYTLYLSLILSISVFFTDFFLCFLSILTGADIRDNLGINVDIQPDLSRTLFIPPLRMLASWLFKATMLPAEFKSGKLQAYRLICDMMTKHQDVLPNSDFLVYLYHVMHKGFTSDDQDVLNTMIRWCSPRFFFLGLPGFTMLVGDFITAAARVLGADSFEAPRIEAQTLLGSLVCFPSLYQQIPSLQAIPGTQDIVVGREDIKDYLVNILLKTARNEPSEGWCSFLPLLHMYRRHVIVGHFDAVVCIWNRVLHCCVSGSNLHTQQSHYLLSLADLSTDYDPFLPLGQVKSSEPQPMHSAAGDFGSLLTVAEEKKRRNMELIPLTARMIMMHLVNHLGHHPLSGGPALLHSLVNENHDNPYVESSELSSEVFKSPNLQLFVFNDSTLVSYLQIPSEGSSAPPREHASEVRVIVRDISGKYSWDGSILYKTLEGTNLHCSSGEEEASFHQHQHHHHTDRSSTSSRPSSSHTSRCSSAVELEDSVDALDQLLEDLGISSPECLPQPQQTLNQPAPPPMGMNHDIETAIMEAIHRQTKQEEEEVAWRRSEDPSVRAANQRPPSQQDPKAPFYFCRLLLNDLGMNSWDRRKSFHLLKKNSKLLRELKNLDSRQCRETHKIAVFYIGEGQEDKYSILSNTEGSQVYEVFVSGLGWEVDLATHCGFMGGLQRNGSTGTTAPYYATSTVEVIFHVSTRMPSDSDDSITKKLRHLGNDEVQIVWSEHTRDYRRGIIPTDFGDVLIIIYPMKNHMFFIQIMKKPQVPFFGPLFDGAIVTGTLLPSLVRATCINASRAVKSRLTLYQSFYEERALYLEAIILNHKENMMFEDFAAQVFSPSPTYYPMSGTGSLSGSTSAELSVTVTTSESSEQVSPTLPRATKSRVSGKLRRSASAISKSSN
uniref:Ral GTPase activating protein, alpha subunit 2 (catalytic) n=1 Tax=Astyanax mexicanus TaxID=7994 RepID=A0A8B9L9E3_ASTMX